MCDFFKRDEYKKKNIYILTHYFHLLHFLKNNNISDLKDLFNSHLHQSIVHELFSENDIILLLDSPYFDINYKYNSNKYEKNLIKSIKNNIYQKNVHLAQIEEAYLLSEKLEKINNPENENDKSFIFNHDLLSHSSKSIHSSSSSEDDEEIINKPIFIDPTDMTFVDEDEESEYDIPLHHGEQEDEEEESETSSANEYYENMNQAFGLDQFQNGNGNITLLNDVYTDPRDNNVFIYRGHGNCEKRFIDEHGNKVRELYNLNNDKEPFQTIVFSGNINVPQLLKNHEIENDETHLIQNITKLNDSIDNYKQVGNIQSNKDDFQNVESDKINNKHLFTYFSSSKSTNYKKYDNCNILILACMKKMDKLVYHLLTYFEHEDINATNKANENALLICCENSLVESSAYLLAHKDIQLNIFNEQKEHLLEICCKNKLNNQALQILSNNEFKKYIIQNRRTSNYTYMIEKALGYACKNNMNEVIFKILENYKLNDEYLNTNENNPLYWCAYHKLESALLLLLKYKNVDVKQIYAKGYHISFFPLLCKNKLEESIFEILKNKSIDLHNNNDIKSPFHWVCKYGLEKVALKLYELNNNIITFDKNNESTKNCLYYASLNNMNHILKIILNDSNIDSNILNINDDLNNTPLILCCKNKNEKRALQILKLKYEKHINVNIYQNNHKKKNALYYAIKHNLKSVIQLLIKDKIAYTPFLLKMFSKLLQNDTKYKYSKIINSYKNSNNNCNICFDVEEKANYLVKCESCVGIFHIQCLSKYFKSSHSSKCPYCRKKSNYFLTK